SEACANSQIYWDGGPKMITKFEEQHAEPCNENWICNRLNLRDLVIDNKDSSEAPNVEEISSESFDTRKSNLRHNVFSDFMAYT
ncbi:hypothetical protein C0991_000696, partial [Blastosporella zonata]